MQGLKLYNLPFVNDAGEAIPPFSIMQIGSGWTDTAERDYFNVVKPTADGRLWIINGPNEVADDYETGYGMATDAPGVLVAYGGGTPAAGEEWGPVDGSWEIEAGGTGYLILGGLATIDGVTVVYVAPLYGAGPRTILITDSVAAATWSGGELTYVEFEATLMNVDGAELVQGDAITVRHDFTTAISVSSGKGKIGKIVGNQLFNVDCNEVTV